MTDPRGGKWLKMTKGTETDRQRDRREEGGERISFISELTPLRSAFKER